MNTPPTSSERDDLKAQARRRLRQGRGVDYLSLPNVALPDWVSELRSHQVDAVRQIMEAFDDGARVVMLDAPTGSGKTVIGELTRQLLGVKALYVCSTKTLQDQVLHDFSYAAVLKGRANYPVRGGASWGDMNVTTADCTRTAKNACRWCVPNNACPYQVAKRTAAAAGLAVLNTSYFLTDSNKGSEAFTGRGLVIADEADLLEGELMSQVTVEISRRRMKDLGIPFPERKTLPKGEQVQPAWVEWAETALRQVTNRLTILPEIDDEKVTATQVRERKGLANLAGSLSMLRAELREGGWVLTDYDRGDVTFKPVRVDRYGEQMLWRHSPRWLLMSGTILSAQEMAESLGLNGDWRTVTIDSTYPVQNRPIIVAPTNTANVAKTKDQAVPEIIAAVTKILEKHPGERTLIHTVSYALAKDIAAGIKDLGREVVTYTSAREREKALLRYRTTDGAVMVASSMDRGIDLPGDQCRVQIIAKVPFPYLGDKQVNARMYSPGGKTWYSINTCRTLLQMTGRGVRSSDDWCVTYILDRAFGSNLWPQVRSMLPGWWVDAMTWTKASEL